MPKKGGKHDESIKKQIVLTLLFSTDKRSRPIHLRFDSILDAEKKLGINRGYIYRLANNHSKVYGELSVSGNIRIEGSVMPRMTKKQQEEQEVVDNHLKNMAWYCEKHKVHIAAGKECPLCIEDNRKQLQSK